jgi:glycosyltransferase involved in cell wall biosynthesis
VYAKLPAFGGVTWTSQDYCLSDTPSKRRVILLKGRDNTDPVTAGGDPQGRAMTAMNAFALCEDILQDYSIVITQATPAIEIQAKILNATTNLKITVFPNTVSLPYEKWLNLLGAARILIAVTISDGLPSTLVEAMSLGVFPIHSSSGTVSEWIKDRENGYLVHAQDVQGVEKALREAVLKDDLVDRAAEINKDLVASKLSDSAVRPQVLDLYRSFVSSRK